MRLGNLLFSWRCLVRFRSLRAKHRLRGDLSAWVGPVYSAFSNGMTETAMRKPTSPFELTSEHLVVRRVVIFTAYTGLWTHRILARAMQLENVVIVHVFAQPPRDPAANGVSSTESTKLQCQLGEVPFAYIASANDQGVQKALASMRPDWVWSFGYGEIFGATTISIPSSGFFNFHPSLLPAHKGPDPFTSVLMKGERHTGLSVHEVAAVIDGGRLVYQNALDILPDDTCRRLMLRMGQFAAEQLPSIVAAIAQLSHIDLSQRKSSYFKKPSGDEFRLKVEDDRRSVLTKFKSAGYSNPFFFVIETVQIVITDLMITEDVVFDGFAPGSMVEALDGLATIKMKGYLLTILGADIHNLDTKSEVAKQLRFLLRCGRTIL